MFFICKYPLYNFLLSKQNITMKKSIGKGSIILIVSGMLCKMLGAFFRLPLTNILGIEGIGVFQMVMAVYSFALVLTSGGVSTALSKFVSQARARGDFGKVKSLMKTALTYSIVLGFVAGAILFAFAFPLAKAQGAESGKLAYRLMVLLIPFGGIIATMRGIFQGYENMTPTAVSQIIEQAIKFVLGLLFAYLLGSKSIESGVFGAFLGVCAGEIVAIIYLRIYMKVKTQFVPQNNHLATASFIKAVVPLSLGVAVLPLVGAIDSFIVVSRLKLAGIDGQMATSLFGLQTGVVGAILNFPLILSSSIAMAILPSISFLDAKLSPESEKAISDALKIMWIVLLPIVFGIACVCRPLYQLIYPSLDETMLSFAVQLTYLGAVSTIISALMQFFIALLQAKGKWNYIMLSYMIGGALKVIAVVILCALPAVNIFGVVVGNILLSSTVCIMALVKNKKKISIGLFDLSLPLLSAIAMTLTVSLLLNRFDLSPIMQIIFSVFCGGGVYIFFSLPLLAGIFKEFFAKKLSGEQNEQNTIN